MVLFGLFSPLSLAISITALIYSLKVIQLLEGHFRKIVTTTDSLCMATALYTTSVCWVVNPRACAGGFCSWSVSVCVCMCVCVCAYDFWRTANAFDAKLATCDKIHCLYALTTCWAQSVDGKRAYGWISIITSCGTHRLRKLQTCTIDVKQTPSLLLTSIIS